MVLPQACLIEDALRVNRYEDTTERQNTFLSSPSEFPPDNRAGAIGFDTR